MSFFDEPLRNNGGSRPIASSSKVKTVSTSSPAVKPRIIKTVVTQVAPPPPTRPKIEHRRTSELIRNGRSERTASNGSSSSNGAQRELKRPAGSATPPRKKAKIAPKRRAVSSSSSDESSDGGHEGPTNGTNGVTDAKEAEEAWRALLAKRPLFDVSGVGRVNEGLITSRSIVEANLSKYKAYFPQDGLAVTSDPLPAVSLTYPSGVTEEFLLLTPKVGNEYDPMHELAQVMRTIYRIYVPPSHTHLFEADAQRSHSHTTTSPRPDSPYTPSRGATPSTPAGDVGTPDRAEEPILRSLQRALNRRDGPGLVHTVERFNSVMSMLRVHDMTAWLEQLNRGGEGLARAEWEGLVDVVGGQVYQRVVGPQSEGLKGYVPFSDNVYGELLPRFMTEIVNRYKVGPDSVFVDLGSGVGNCLIQVAMQTGCAAFGAEQMPHPSALAVAQIDEAKRRWAMWMVTGNEDRPTEAWECDFCEDERVGEQIKKADVVLINNYAFTASLNERIVLAAFLELKDGAKVISLKPFLTEGFRLTERTAGSPLAILRMQKHRYPPNSVSWTNEGGVFYEHTVDRSVLARFFDKQAARASRRQD